MRRGPLARKSWPVGRPSFFRFKIGALRRQGMAAIVRALTIVVCPQQDGQPGSRRIRFIFVPLRLAMRFVFAPGAPPDNIWAASVRAVLTALRL